jgi:hypothetical protein
MALSADRNTARAERGHIKSLPVAAATKVFGGGLTCRNAAGYAVKGSAALNLKAVGRANEQVDNSAGSAGDLSVKVEEGIFFWKNSASGDLITVADIGNRAFIVDDETVAKTSGGGTRSPAGIIVYVGTEGVGVLMGDGVVGSRKIYVPMRLATLVGTPAYYAVAPVAGRITNILAIREGVLTTGNATVQFAINGVDITTGLMTMVQAASAAGDVNQLQPTALNVVAAGDKIRATVGGTNATATVANVLLEIEID